MSLKPGNVLLPGPNIHVTSTLNYFLVMSALSIVLATDKFVMPYFLSLLGTGYVQLQVQQSEYGYEIQQCNMLVCFKASLQSLSPPLPATHFPPF